MRRTISVLVAIAVSLWPGHGSLYGGMLSASQRAGVLSPEHGLFYNGTAIRTGGWPPVKIDYSIEKQKMVHAVRVYALAHKTGLTTAQMDMNAIFIASGYNIRHLSLGEIKNLQVAPILAALLQVHLPHPNSPIPQNLFAQ